MRIVYVLVVLFVILGTNGPMSPDVAGRTAPNFILPNYNGKTIELHRFRGKIVVLEWIHCECTFIKAHYNDDVHTMLDLRRQYAGQEVIWLSINSTHTATDQANREWAAQHQLSYVLLDADGRVGKQYGAKTSPHIFIIDKKGKLAYQGAIDNAPLGFLRSGKYINYVDRALEELTTGRPVSIKRTFPYGCRIKYAEMSVQEP